MCSRRIVKNIIICPFFLLYIPTIYADIIQIPEDYFIIQDAINNSAVGDTILIDEGLYTESIEINDHGLTFSSNYIFDNDSSFINNTILRPINDENRIITI